MSLSFISVTVEMKGKIGYISAVDWPLVIVSTHV